MSFGDGEAEYLLGIYTYRVTILSIDFFICNGFMISNLITRLPTQLMVCPGHVIDVEISGEDNDWGLTQ